MGDRLARARGSALLLAFALCAACGERGEGALGAGDPLHEHAIALPPPERGLPPAPVPPKAEPEHIAVPPPPFSEGIFPCSSCHEGGAPSVDARPAVPHRKHLDRDLSCADCHGEGEPRIPAAEACLECHGDLKSEPEAVKAYFAAVKDAEGAYRLPRRWETRDAKANHAGHAKAGVACAACHGEPSDAPFAKPKSVTLMAACVACHEERKAPQKCESCHETIRERQHANIVLKHAEEQRGCLDCHSAEDRDRLHLANGTKIEFSESYLLCGQCHGPNLRDWRAGIHGKRTGMWDGRKEYLLCAHCHNPHAPPFQPLRPLPPPVRPEEIR